MTIGASVAEGIDPHRLLPKAEIPGRVAATPRRGLASNHQRLHIHRVLQGQRQRIGIARHQRSGIEFVA
ncbi:MAG: hypothetical protein R2882_12515 [Gemmatimonadales bacterium]